MLLNIDPVLTGELLLALDEMGHTDSVVVADAHFPASRIAALAGAACIDVPGLSTPRVLAAVRSVLPPDADGDALDLMDAPGGLLEVQSELIEAAGLTLETTNIVERFAFYDVAAKASLIIRTGETRIYGNAIFRKGVVPAPQGA